MRLTGIHRDTIMRLGARIGLGCAALHDQMMQEVPATLIELDGSRVVNRGTGGRGIGCGWR
jgi:hypothetical protein